MWLLLFFFFAVVNYLFYCLLLVTANDGASYQDVFDNKSFIIPLISTKQDLNDGNQRDSVCLLFFFNKY